MLRHDVINGDSTSHVTHSLGSYCSQNFSNKQSSHGGNPSYGLQVNHSKVQKLPCMDRHSTDVDDGVISSDGDYDSPLSKREVAESDIENKGLYDLNKNKSSSRLSHAESTDSGMGFIDNGKENENVPSSALDDSYGTIRPMQTQHDEPENRKSLIDGDAEYDEVMEFISTPTEIVSESENSANGLHSDPSTHDTSSVSGPNTSPPGSSKYAELDLAKILHTRRRRRNILTTEPEEVEKPPEVGMFDSLKRKSKSKNYSFGNYATYSRSRKPSRQQSSDTWNSRPSSTACAQDDTVLSPFPPSATLGHRQNYTLLDIEVAQERHASLKSRSNFTNDLMMTSDISEDTMTPPPVEEEKRFSWRNSIKSPSPVNEIEEEDPLTNTNRWSMLSNSSQPEEKPPAMVKSKNTLNVFRRLFGGSSADSSNQKSGTSSSKDASAVSTPNISRTSKGSLLRKFSMKKSSKSVNSLNKRRGSVPVKSEWDVRRHDDDAMDIEMTLPVTPTHDTPEEQSFVRPKHQVSAKGKKTGSRLMSFRSNKSRNSKSRKKQSMTKGLSISSPQLAVNAVNPTRNYTENQLMTVGSPSGLG